MRETIGVGEFYVIEVEEIEKSTGVHTYMYYGPYDHKSTAKGVLTQERNRNARWPNEDFITNMRLKSTEINWKTVTD